MIAKIWFKILSDTCCISCTRSSSWWTERQRRWQEECIVAVSFVVWCPQNPGRRRKFFGRGLMIRLAWRWNRTGSKHIVYRDTATQTLWKKYSALTVTTRQGNMMSTPPLTPKLPDDKQQRSEKEQLYPPRKCLIWALLYVRSFCKGSTIPGMLSKVLFFYDKYEFRRAYSCVLLF
jgi:hypothetical protein